MQMLVLPPVILIAVIDALTCNTQSGAYAYTPEVKDVLHNLSLTNHACHRWSTSILYNRVTVAGDQIAQLAVTLSGATPRAQSLSKRIQSLRILVADYTQRSDPMGGDKIIDDALYLLRILAPTLSLQRLFVDTNVVDGFLEKNPDLHSAISCLTSLAELTLINQQNRHADFFWDMELCSRTYDCLSGLRALTVGDVTINESRTIAFLLPLVHLKELVLIRPWINRRYTEVGSILSGLFAPQRALQHLTLVLVNGWLGWAVESLTVEDLGPEMIPHLDKVDTFSERDAESSRSWRDIGNMIGMGHRRSRRTRGGATMDDGHVTQLLKARGDN
ncbi:hypothetical protein FRB94_009205 [Tulasnella sp. JGI-2019a]|nr:hypothetical protein FRB93_008334 [Tulasnella sp. JGI-2019a]KAG8995343.1 hypothetical protein FRB94_009205 [Tulasnella sp. JGI-2019a]KAG9026583.1 hypothetical protein FRB95_008670 [Tulasnella sp. JGI-2019a]